MPQNQCHKLSIRMKRSLVVLCIALSSILFLVAGTEIPDEHIDHVFEEMDKEIRSMYKREPTVVRRKFAHAYKKRVLPEVSELGIRTTVFAHASERIASIYNLTRAASDSILQKRQTPRKEFHPNDICTRKDPECVPQSRYRTEDGSCNNLQRPRLGMAVSIHERFLPAAYSDSNGGFRESVTGEALPSPRFISSKIHVDVSRFHNFATHMIVGLGQFLDHDITSTPEAEDLQCCTNPPNNPECMAIPVPPNDPFYSTYGVKCIDISRSIRACGSGTREQINQVTSFIDGSPIYGSSVTEQNNLRAFTGGLLATDENPRLMPKDANISKCGIPAKQIYCFKSGDDRVNENPGLLSMHTIWFREHNRIAAGLQTINPQWSDETLFQQAKRIVAAEFQNVVFSEFLPTILGPTIMKNFSMNLPTSGYSTYDSKAIPQTLNEFSTAAMRFGHTLVQNDFKMSGNKEFSLKENFQNPQIVYQSSTNIDRIMLGFSEQPSQTYDNFISNALTNHLLQKTGDAYGSDLVSLNIQRGRDHGLQPYNEYRAKCGLAKVTKFDQLAGLFGSQETANNFRASYRSVADIDLWPAGVSELPVPGGVVGETFACILANQFKRLLAGDRYFFTHSTEPQCFTLPQLQNIRPRTLASIICDNASPTVVNLQLNVFKQTGAKEPCYTHPKLNLNNWKGV